MKVFIIAVIILTLIITCVYFINNYINSFSDKMVKKIEEIRNYALKKDIEKSQVLFNQAYNDWIKNEKYLRMFIDHEIVENIHIDLIELSLEIKYEQMEDVDRECRKMIFKVRHLIEREKLTGPNLF